MSYKFLMLVLICRYFVSCQNFGNDPKGPVEAGLKKENQNIPKTELNQQVALTHFYRIEKKSKSSISIHIKSESEFMCELRCSEIKLGQEKDPETIRYSFVKIAKPNNDIPGFREEKLVFEPIGSSSGIRSIQIDHIGNLKQFVKISVDKVLIDDQVYMGIQGRIKSASTLGAQGSGYFVQSGTGSMPLHLKDAVIHERMKSLNLDSGKLVFITGTLILEDGIETKPKHVLNVDSIEVVVE
jgi:hypothetical protein